MAEFPKRDPQMTPEELRAKCEKLARETDEWFYEAEVFNRVVNQYMEFAREIRNDVLEEACACFQDEHEHVPTDFIVQRVRALKDLP